jgi:hypothetical protein
LRAKQAKSASTSDFRLRRPAIRCSAGSAVFWGSGTRTQARCPSS